MKSNDIIIVDNIPEGDYYEIVNEAVSYALISLPFTIDRMRIPNHIRRTLNIAKGKIAEELFKWYCKSNNIKIDFESCETPFWEIDKRDFILYGFEWDIKNNFIYHQGNIFDDNLKLPALIPNRHDRDQWSTKDQKKIENSKGVKYLFTFLKGADLTNNKRGGDFLTINLSFEQSEFISDLYEKYRGMPQTQRPFDDDWFWKELKKRGSSRFFSLSFMPYLVITGYADENHWHLFKDTGPYSPYNYQDYFQEKWYKKVGHKNSLMWLNGALWTTITNKTCPLPDLPSFKSLIE